LVDSLQIKIVVVFYLYAFLTKDVKEVFHC
jgi:hypothetical protein